jgi:hypothetical protein
MRYLINSEWDRAAVLLFSISPSFQKPNGRVEQPCGLVIQHVPDQLTTVFLDEIAQRERLLCVYPDQLVDLASTVRLHWAVLGLFNRRLVLEEVHQQHSGISEIPSLSL